MTPAANRQRSNLGQNTYLVNLQRLGSIANEREGKKFNGEQNTNRPRHESYHLFPSGAEFKNEWISASTLPFAFMGAKGQH